MRCSRCNYKKVIGFYKTKPVCEECYLELKRINRDKPKEQQENKDEKKK